MAPIKVFVKCGGFPRSAGQRAWTVERVPASSVLAHPRTRNAASTNTAGGEDHPRTRNAASANKAGEEDHPRTRNAASANNVAGGKEHKQTSNAANANNVAGGKVQKRKRPQKSPQARAFCRRRSAPLNPATRTNRAPHPCQPTSPTWHTPAVQPTPCADAATPASSPLRPAQHGAVPILHRSTAH